MGFLITIVVFSILIVIHEFGHFIAAKRSGVRVEKFAIGFGPPILKINGKETQFLICVFPLGGYVKLAGDSRAEAKGLKHEFLSKPVGVRARIVFAGPLFNYLFALVIFWVIALIGFPYLDTVVGETLDGYPAQAAGVREADKILEVNGQTVDSWAQMSKVIYSSKEKVLLKIDREGKTLNIEVPLSKKEITDDFGKKKKVSVIGIAASFKTKVIKYGFFEAIIKGAESLFSLTFLVIKGFLFIILGIIPFKEALGGPVVIYYYTSEAVKIGLIPVLHLMAVLNVSLAIINLFPVPVLDGGHIFFFFLEKMRKKPLPEKAEDALTRVGLGLILMLIVFILYNDIVKVGPKLFNKEVKREVEIGAE